jgi:hypothetical protein
MIKILFSNLCIFKFKKATQTAKYVLLFALLPQIRIILMSVFLVRLPLSPGDFLDLGYHNSDLLRLTPSFQQPCEYNNSNKYPNQIPCKQEYEYKYGKKAYKQK